MGVDVGIGRGVGVGVSIGASIGECMITIIVYNFFIPHPNRKIQKKFGIVKPSSVTRTKLPISYLRA